MHDRPTYPATTRLLTLLLLLLAAPLVGCGRASVAGDEEGRVTAERFLSDLREGRVEPAWQSTTVEFKSLMGLEPLREQLKLHPALKAPATFEGATRVDARGLELSECRFKATATAPAKGKPKARQPATALIKVTLARNSDGWNVEKLDVE